MLTTTRLLLGSVLCVVLVALAFQLFLRYAYIESRSGIYRLDRLTQRICRIAPYDDCSNGNAPQTGSRSFYGNPQPAAQATQGNVIDNAVTKPRNSNTFDPKSAVPDIYSTP